jgi:hypothetical protein
VIEGGQSAATAAAADSERISRGIEFHTFFGKVFSQKTEGSGGRIRARNDDGLKGVRGGGHGDDDDDLDKIRMVTMGYL